MNGDGVVDAYYDTSLGVTWLYNMQLAGNPGFMTWTQAMQWVAALNIGGYTGWRLPTINPNSCAWEVQAEVCANGPQGKTAELPYMKYVTLANTRGPFTNGLPVYDGHWFNVTVAGQPDRAWGFYWYAFDTNAYLKTNFEYPWPVHQGDVGTPLP